MILPQLISYIMYNQFNRGTGETYHDLPLSPASCHASLSFISSGIRHNKRLHRCTRALVPVRMMVEREMDASPETEQHLGMVERVIELNNDAAVELDKQIEAIGGHEA
jgi:hypothetical protein